MYKPYETLPNNTRENEIKLFNIIGIFGKGSHIYFCSFIITDQVSVYDFSLKDWWNNWRNRYVLPALFYFCCKNKLRGERKKRGVKYVTRANRLVYLTSLRDQVLLYLITRIIIFLTFPRLIIFVSSPNVYRHFITMQSFPRFFSCRERWHRYCVRRELKSSKSLYSRAIFRIIVASVVSKVIVCNIDHAHSWYFNVSLRCDIYASGVFSRM